MGTKIYTLDALIRRLQIERSQLEDDDERYVVIGTPAGDNLKFQLQENGAVQLGTHVYAGLKQGLGEGGLLGMQVSDFLQGTMIAPREQLTQEAIDAAVTAEEVEDALGNEEGDTN